MKYQKHVYLLQSPRREFRSLFGDIAITEDQADHILKSLSSDSRKISHYESTRWPNPIHYVIDEAAFGREHYLLSQRFYALIITIYLG